MRSPLLPKGCCTSPKLRFHPSHHTVIPKDRRPTNNARSRSEKKKKKKTPQSEKEKQKTSASELPPQTSKSSTPSLAAVAVKPPPRSSLCLSEARRR
ncbi:hypothetical protein ACLB2K_016432 [Fragaria x ananassa]